MERDKVFLDIIQEIELGRSLKNILDNESSLIDRSTFYRWLNDNPERIELYKRATEIRADNIFDDMLELADDGSKDYYYDVNGNRQQSMVAVNRSRLQLDTRKWVLGRMNPKKYSEKLDITSGGDKLKVVPIIGMQIINQEEEKIAE
jgi:hypothetical protein